MKDRYMKHSVHWSFGDITVGCRTYDQEATGSTLGRVTILYL